LQFATAFAAFAFLLLVGVDAAGILSTGRLAAGVPAAQEFAVAEEAPLMEREAEVPAEGEALMDAAEEDRSAAEGGALAPETSATAVPAATSAVGELAEEPAMEEMAAADEADQPPLELQSEAEAPTSEPPLGSQSEPEPASEPLIGDEFEVPVSTPTGFWRAISGDPRLALLRGAEAALALMVIVLTFLSLRLRPRD
jgi:hypothetical protein